MLSEIMKEDYIQLRVQAEDWEDAIRKSAVPLLKDGAITQSYVDAMITSVKETGPYIAITPHLALAHARPEYGAKEIAIGITTVVPPVEIGNKENDPIKYIFCLSAVDQKTHLNAMSALARLLDKDEFYNMLDTAKDAKEVLEYIKAYE
ncbi:Phosphoenolpyruvate-dependent sugar phosphotransferase system, EIIA 2 (fragment) [uncultured Eubacteriales bacterium]|uniref:Ascorbate-specific PTS system EIIA component n=1 Tax=uncultured Eubacteriales bacterium TaxID=172733 RepID=A0A212K927_9FIRM